MPDIRGPFIILCLLRWESARTPHPPLRGPPSPTGEGRNGRGGVQLCLLRWEKVSRRAATDEASDATDTFPSSSESRTSAGTSPMPSPVGEGGSQRMTDEAFFLSVEVLQKATRYSSSTAPRSPFSDRRRQRRAKVDIIDGRSAGRKAFGSSGAPTPTGGRAEVGIANGRSAGERAEVQICLLRWEKVAAEG